jgi:hypothetical protein
VDAAEKITDTANRLASACLQLDILKQQMAGVIRDLSSLENLKADKQAVQHTTSEMQAVSKQLYTQISLKENHIVTIENFIEKYLPMRVLTQTGQVLASVLEDGYADKINTVVNSLLDQLREHILKDSGIPDLMEVMSKMNKRVKQISHKSKNVYETQ